MDGKERRKLEAGGMKKKKRLAGREGGNRMKGKEWMDGRMGGWVEREEKGRKDIAVPAAVHALTHFLACLISLLRCFIASCLPLLAPSFTFVRCSFPTFCSVLRAAVCWLGNSEFGGRSRRDGLFHFSVLGKSGTEEAGAGEG